MLNNLFLRDGGNAVSGGSAPETPIAPVINAPAEKVEGDINPFEATPEELANLNEKEKETPADQIEITDDIVDDTPDDGKPKETPLAESEFDSISEADLLAELGLEGEYPDLRTAMSALKTLKGSTNTDRQQLARLAQAAKNTGSGATVDDIIASLEGISPDKMAGQGPQWANVDKFLEQHSDAENIPFYKNLMSNAIRDMIPQIQSQFSQIIQTIAGDYDGLKEDFSLDKFMRQTNDKGELKNASWKGREQEIKDALKLNPQYRGKPNAIALATQFIMAGKEPPSVSEKVAKETRKKLQILQSKKRSSHLEGPGRSAPPGKATTDINKFSTKQLEGVIENAEKKGHKFI